MSKLNSLPIAAITIVLLLAACLSLPHSIANAQEQPHPFSISSAIDGKNYTIEGKSLGNSTAMPKSFKIDPASKSIEVQVNGKGDLQMTLPKAMIDGVNLVISGGDQFYFKEIDANSTSTTIQINIPRQVESIKIIATMVVPEFPLSTIGVIAVGFAAIAVIGRTRLMKGFYSERLDQTSEVQFSPSET